MEKDESRSISQIKHIGVANWLSTGVNIKEASMMFRFCLEREDHLLTVETSLVLSGWTWFLHVKQFHKMSISNKDRDVTSMD